MRLTFFAFFAFFAASSFGQNDKISSIPSFQKVFSYNGFLKNTGQVRDLQNQKVNNILYSAQTDGKYFYLTDKGISFLFWKVKKNTKRVSSINISKKEVNDTSASVMYDLERTDIVLLHASILPENILSLGSNETSQFNFYQDKYSESGLGLKLSSELLIKNVYPGIDWRLFIKKNNAGNYFEYQFVVHPGANPNNIELKYSRNSQLTKSKTGGITAVTQMGLINQIKPTSYISENNKAVTSDFIIRKQITSFSIGSYDHSQTLIIDPDVFWGTFLTAISPSAYQCAVAGSDVRTDSVGNIFLQLSYKGTVPFPTLDPGNGAYYQDYQASPNGGMVIMKFTPGGVLVWSTFFSGVAQTVGIKMAIDNLGNVCTVGAFAGDRSTIPLLDNGGYFDTTRKKSFITKFDNFGRLKWCTFFTDFESGITDVTSDRNGNFYLTGWSGVYTFPTVNPGMGAYCVLNPQYGSARVFFISQFNSNNQLVWSTRIEGNDDDDLGTRVHVDNLGNIYIAGGGRSTNYPLVNAGGYFNSSGLVMLSKFNSNRQMVWSTYYSNSFPYKGIATDDSCNLYLVNGKMIAKFNPNTQIMWEKQIATNRLYFLKDIVYDRANQQFQVLGVMNDVEYDFPAQNTSCNGSFFFNGHPPSTYSIAVSPIFLTFNNDGVFSYLSLADWTQENYEYSEMAVDPYGNPIYLFNQNRNWGFTATPNPNLHNPGNGAYYDSSCATNGQSSFLLKLSPSVLNATIQVLAPNNCSCNGNVHVSIQCGATPFHYLWSRGDTSSSLLNVCQGSYWVKITDSTHLSKTIYFNVLPPPGSITSIIKNIIPENCNKANGRVSITSIIGGSSPYSYSIDGGPLVNSSVFTALDSGKHILRIRDVNGCQFYDTTLVGRISGPTKIFVKAVKSRCDRNDGKLIIDSVHGGVAPYIYTVNGQQSTTGIFQNLAPGTYTVLVSDTAGCSLPIQATILRFQRPSGVNLNISDDHCNSGIGSILVDSVIGGTAPYTFSLDSISFVNNTLINRLHAAQYTLYIRDSNGCVLNHPSVLLNNISGPGFSNYSVSNAICGRLQGTLKINSVQSGVAPYKYAIDSDSLISGTLFQNINPGVHTLRIKDSYSCLLRDTFSVTYIESTVFKLLPKDTTVCYDEIVHLNLQVRGSTVKNVSWNVPSQGNSITIKAARNQIVYVSAVDSEGCILKDTAYLNVKACNSPDKCVMIPNAFSPNYDQHNDNFGATVNGCRIKDFTFQVYNRYGELLFESTNSIKKWNGLYKNEMQPTGIYVFLCRYKGEDNIDQFKKGSFVLIR